MTTSLPPWPSRNNKRSAATPSSSIITTTPFTTTHDEDDAHNHSDLAEVPELSDVVASISLLVYRFYGPIPPPPSVASASAAAGGHHQQQQGGGSKKRKRNTNMSSSSNVFHACPLVLHHQLYTVLEDQTAVDMEIENFRRQNFVRLLRLLTPRQDVGVLLTSTYLARVQAAIDLYTANAEAQQQQHEQQQRQQPQQTDSAKPGNSEQGAASDGGTSSKAAAAATAAAAAEEMVFALSFFRKAVRTFTTLSVTRQQLESLMTTALSQRRGRGDEEEDEEGTDDDGYPLKVPSSLLRNQKSNLVADMMHEAAVAAVAAAEGKKISKTKTKTKSQGKQKGSSSSTFAGPCLDLAIRQLLKIGFLARRVDSRLEEAYWFSAPEIGRITASLPHGRKAILAALNRSRYKELLERNLQEVDLKQSMLPHSFHLADLVGSKEVLAVATAAGTFLRLPPGAALASAARGGGGGGARRM